MTKGIQYLLLVITLLLSSRIHGELDRGHGTAIIRSKADLSEVLRYNLDSLRYVEIDALIDPEFLYECENLKSLILTSDLLKPVDLSKLTPDLLRLELHNSPLNYSGLANVPDFFSELVIVSLGEERGKSHDEYFSIVSRLDELEELRYLKLRGFAFGDFHGNSYPLPSLKIEQLVLEECYVGPNQMKVQESLRSLVLFEVMWYEESDLALLFANLRFLDVSQSDIAPESRWWQHPKVEYCWIYYSFLDVTYLNFNGPRLKSVVLEDTKVERIQLTTTSDSICLYLNDNSIHQFEGFRERAMNVYGFTCHNNLAYDGLEGVEFPNLKFTSMCCQEMGYSYELSSLEYLFLAHNQCSLNTQSYPEEVEVLSYSDMDPVISLPGFNEYSRQQYLRKLEGEFSLGRYSSEGSERKTGSPCLTY